MVREGNLRQVYAFALTPELQQRQKPPEKDRALLQLGVPVVEDLGKEGIAVAMRCAWIYPSTTYTEVSLRQRVRGTLI